VASFSILKSDPTVHNCAIDKLTMVNIMDYRILGHLHLVPRLRMRAAIPPLPQYVFTAWCLVKG
jgi:hypothetical protein